LHLFPSTRTGERNRQYLTTACLSQQRRNNRDRPSRIKYIIDKQNGRISYIITHHECSIKIAAPVKSILLHLLRLIIPDLLNDRQEWQIQCDGQPGGELGALIGNTI
jgi:hypothetical protein